MSKKLILLGLMIPSLTFATNHMLVIGGGGEPNKSSTIFDYELKNATQFVKRSNWQTRISFNGGHSETEKIAQEFAAKSQGRNSSFTPQNYEAIISEYERKIRTGAIKSGDQLILMISSHGGQQMPHEKTHIISTSSEQKQALADYGTLAGTDSPPVSLDLLENLTKLAKSKGINLGILDFSCHSGVTQKLANENTCVISSTGPNHFAWGGTPQTFAAQFTEHMSSGKSLEDVFLAALKNKDETSFPMISSPVGNMIQEVMYPLITPYLYDTRSAITSSKMKSFYNKRYAEDRCEGLSSDYDELINFTYDMENISNRANYTNLRNLVGEYQQLQAGILNNLNLVNSRFNLSKKEEFCDINGGTKICLTYSIEEILNTKPDEMISLLRRQQNSSRSPLTTGRINLYEKVKKRQEQLLKDQAIQTSINFWDRSSHLNSTQNLAQKISREADTVFYNSYAALLKEEGGSSGPCAKIKL